MPDPDIAEAFAKHQPWITKYVLRGTESGGWFDAPNDPRIGSFRRCFPEARRILELGSLEGGHTIGLAQLPGIETVVGVEGRTANFERALLAKELFAIPNIEFVQANLEQVRLSEFGPFDVIYCSGLLYHLPEPWRLVEQFAASASGLFLWTHCASEASANIFAESYKGLRQAEGGSDEPLSGLSPDSFWPTLGSLCTMLTTHGFSQVRLLANDLEHEHGPAVTLAAYV
ncbi:MAG: class I SAM-dependent methyltransferase [Chthoniobacterales bacterium]